MVDWDSEAVVNTGIGVGQIAAEAQQSILAGGHAHGGGVEAAGSCGLCRAGYSHESGN
jgi:hypothetical protein